MSGKGQRRGAESCRGVLEGEGSREEGLAQDWTR